MLTAYFLSHFCFIYPNFWINLATSKKSVNAHAYCTMCIQHFSIKLPNLDLHGGRKTGVVQCSPQEIKAKRRRGDFLLYNFHV